jgi:cytochrome c2
MRIHTLTGILALAAACILAACGGGQAARDVVVPGGDPDRGATLIQRADCGSCHAIPGIRGASGHVGPPLNWMARRTYIAGRVPNEPSNMVLWVSNPKTVDPLTAMPDLGLTEQQARDIAAYLYTLH